MTDVPALKMEVCFILFKLNLIYIRAVLDQDSNPRLRGSC